MVITLYLKYSNISTTVIEYNSKQNQPQAPTKISANLITVHLAGAVKKPGVYTIAFGTRILDFITSYSGFVDTANLDKLNLAKLATDGQRIYIPYKKDTRSNTNSSIGLSTLININTSSKKQLQKLPGVGQRIAKEIIEYRKSHGFFYSKKEVLNVKFIGPKLYEKIHTLINI